MTRQYTALLAAVLLTVSADAQEVPWTPDDPGSDNIHVLSHVPLGPPLSVADLELEQETSRPFAYVGRMQYGGEGPMGMDVIDLSDSKNISVLRRWRIENQDLHTGLGGMDVKYFKMNDRYYVVQSLQFGPGGPDADLGAVVFDVTDLPNDMTEVARVHAPERPGGFHNIFIYRHSDGRALLFTTTSGPSTYVYDLAKVIDGDAGDALAGEIPIPEQFADPSQSSYHDFYAGYHPDTDEDRFYGGGTGGYYVFDISNLENPELRISLTNISGVKWGHTFTPGPRGRYAVAETEYRYAPLRIFDLQPALDGEQTNISEPISAWTADWKNLTHNHEVRWPYVFVSGYLDGLQVFSLMDPENPTTVGYYDTYLGPENTNRYPVFNGAFGIDVRNEDGLIVVSDMSTGFWTFRMDGFEGWNGADWGVPNISSVQNWDEGPVESYMSTPGSE